MNRKEVRKRTYEIYGVPKRERQNFELHHIVFDSEGGEYRLGNLCPLRPEIHAELHTRISRMEHD